MNPLPASPASSASATAAMKANRRSDTKLETRVRSMLHRNGLRFRKDFYIRVEGCRVHADIAFTKQRVAIFLDGCYWHGCPEHGSMPKANRAYWEAKFARNATRDDLVNRSLEAAGWRVVRIWEHVPPSQAVAIIRKALRTKP